MKKIDAKMQQEIRLRNICEEFGIDYDSLVALLDSVKTKKLLKRNNYHQQKINDIIERAIK